MCISFLGLNSTIATTASEVLYEMPAPTVFFHHALKLMSVWIGAPLTPLTITEGFACQSWFRSKVYPDDMNMWRFCRFMKLVKSSVGLFKPARLFLINLGTPIPAKKRLL